MNDDIHTRAWNGRLADYDYFLIVCLRRGIPRKRIAYALNYSLAAVNMRVAHLKRKHNVRGIHALLDKIEGRA